jgi:hypothetical protein
MDQYFPGVSQNTPVYQLLAPAYLDDDTYHVEGETIAYEGEPNEHMAPLNEPARIRMRTMLDHLEQCAREKAEFVGRKYTGRLTDLGDLIAEASRDAKSLAQREQAEAIKRAMPLPMTGPPAPGLPSQKPLSVRKQETDARSSVKAFGAPVQKGRATEVMHKIGQDRLTEKAPLEG